LIYVISSIKYLNFRNKFYKNKNFLILVNMINEQPVPSFDKTSLNHHHQQGGSGQLSEEKRIGQLYCREEIIKWLIGSVLLVELDPVTSSSRGGALTTSSFQSNSNDDTSSSLSNSAISASMSTISSAVSSTGTLTSVNTSSGFGGASELASSTNPNRNSVYDPMDLT
jgi:hypothetical protein